MGIGSRVLAAGSNQPLTSILVIKKGTSLNPSQGAVLIPIRMSTRAPCFPKKSEEPFFCPTLPVEFHSLATVPHSEKSAENKNTPNRYLKEHFQTARRQVPGRRRIASFRSCRLKNLDFQISNRRKTTRSFIGKRKNDTNFIRSSKSAGAESSNSELHCPKRTTRQQKQRRRSHQNIR